MLYVNMSGEFLKTTVQLFIFLFLFSLIVYHIYQQFFYPRLHVENRNRLYPYKEGFEAQEQEMDYATENSNNMSDLFEKVNTQMDVIRTLKVPYTENVVTIKYDANASTDSRLTVFNNLLNLLRGGIAPNDVDLRTNEGITKYVQYGGNDGINDIITELSFIDDKYLDDMQNKVNTDACNKKSDVEKQLCIEKTQKQNLRKTEYDFIKRVMTIVDSHQKLLDRIMENQANE